MKVERIKNPDIKLGQSMLMDSYWGMTGWTKAEREKCWKEMIMKIEKIKKAFEPVVITLENPKELSLLNHILAMGWWTANEEVEKFINHLNEKLND